MPTESTFLFAGLLFIAAALGYVFARFGDPDDEDEADAAARSRYLKGFRYLLDDDSDRAVDAFTSTADSSDEALETQLSLGSLFRRRGELDRAIRLHQDLVDRQASSPAQRDVAAFALAEDYLAAGLFDRAEELFLRLRKSPVHGTPALRRLLRICEVTSDWDRAVALCTELSQAGADEVGAGQLAHYYCELAVQAAQRNEPGRAFEMLARAEEVEPGKARSALVRADLQATGGEAVAAVGTLARLGTREPAVLGEVVPRLVALAAVPGARQAAGDALDLLASSVDGHLGIALAVMRDSRVDEPLALRHLASFVTGQPVLMALLGPDERPGAALEAVARLRPLLNKLIRAGMRFQCASCGYESASMQWQCPGCRSWDSVRPVMSGLLREILQQPVSG